MGNTTYRRPKADIRAAIAAERRELAAVLDGLSDEEWDAPTLCGGWRVREVAAHMTMGFRYSLPRMARELIGARGSLHRMTDRCARKDAATHSTRELAAFLGANADHPWKPPVGGIETALGHDVIHGLDITVALGLGRRVPEDRVRILLEGVDARTLKFFGADLGGIELRADDLDWSFGTGTPLFGAAQDLLLLAYGRRLPPGHLRGEPCDRFLAVRTSGDGGRLPRDRRPPREHDDRP
ncbi:maleylpyruvate isomerase family mycothiol-dependent enzyme [Streptomyces sp. NPDC127051]|uniref:maleylpyruvate isomerase family mycothiol-dependent enzyme n=1 Tax=Streptomyces sp. NPDC127051 TaxID=3347119 RepID=UPI0036498A8C